jgi:hypothetical protein
MSTRSIEHLLPIPDFLEQFAESFEVGREEALVLLGELLLSYEPSWSRESRSLLAESDALNRPSRAA